ncbi:TonB-dependent receptor [Pedobacter frigiditerrae]|uniref:TonB-dependent receptor n=1 Tax=Pedobacter frigiditerrae TaxID=2530452 RepID=A0A4R0MTQ2_9SPHI|nr:TonB-dependent receptor [Pedobacter frigiditerrae]TCC90469.1 TonB-dependent receptor [Pedobacter frigiditerrae]
MKQLYIFLIIILFAHRGSAQITNSIIAKVVNTKGEALELANVKLIETNQYATTDKNGLFKISGIQSNSNITLQVSFIGFQTLKVPVVFKPGENNLGNLSLNVLDLSLEGIDINAKRNYSGSTNSSLIINRELIEQTPALSVNDLLNQIPNRKIQPPSLQRVQNLNLRSAYVPTSTGRGDFELNNAFGIAIIMDGNVISNNANMQSFNPGRSGQGQSFVTSGNYGLNGAPAPVVNGIPSTSYSGDYTFGGTDLRQIPADNIESIEVIAGIAPAKYGDLTDGAIIIERQAGKSPAYVRMQLRDNATSYGFSKGFELNPKLGAVNLGVNYVNSFEDNRDKLKAYRRVNTNAMWTNSFGKADQLKNTFSIDYGRNLDGIKRDPDDEKGTRTRFDSWNFSIANRSNYRFNSGFLKNISFNVRYSEGHQVSYKEELMNDPYVLYTTATATGIHEGTYDTGVYTAKSLIDGRPINAGANLDFTGGFKTGDIAHYLSFGTSFNYGANRGLGQTIDPNEPRSGPKVATTSIGATSSERFYDFKLAIAQKDLGFYVEDLFTANLLGKPLNVRAGIRTDIQNGYASLSPRTNINYEINKNFRLGVAYGLSYKSPGLAQRYPGPTFYEIPLLNSYNGKVNESTYLVYVERYEPTNSGLKPSKSESLELSAQIKIDKFNLSLTAFNKKSRNGISTVQNLQSIVLPTYTATANVGAKPTITQTGLKPYAINYFTFKNDLSSNNQGFEVILNTPEIKEIKTSFNLSGGLFRTAYNSTSNRLSSNIPSTIPTDPNYAYIGVYEPSNTKAYFSNGRITSITHIPKLSLVIQFVAEFDLLNKTINTASSRIPLGYYNSVNQYTAITNFDQKNPSYGHLYVTPEEQKENDLPKIISNYHFSIAKEIKKRFKFAFNVYNVFNYQPYYLSTTGTYKFPNSSPTFGAELSIKL